MKISKSHGSKIEAVEEILIILKKSGLVSKVALGYITVVKRKNRSRRIKYKKTRGGILLTIISGINKQELYIYTDRTEEILSLLDLE